MNMAPMSEPNTMIPAQAATQKIRRAATSRSYSGFAARRCRMTNATPAATATTPRPSASVPSSGTGAKLIAEDQRADEDDGQDATEVVDRFGRLVDVARHEADRHDQGDDGERQRDEEDRAPPELLEQDPGDQRPERRDRAADRRPQRDRPRPRRARPQRGDQRQRGRVGHAGRQPPSIRATNST